MLPCSDGYAILELPTLTPEKTVSLPYRCNQSVIIYRVGSYGEFISRKSQGTKNLHSITCCDCCYTRKLLTGVLVAKPVTSEANNNQHHHRHHAMECVFISRINTNSWCLYFEGSPCRHKRKTKCS